MREDVDLMAGFAGTVEVHVSEGTGRGYTDLTLTAGKLDWQAEEYFGRYHCHWLASALSGLTGWPLAVFERQAPDGSWKPLHSGVVAPTGRVLDIFGERAPSAVQRFYSESEGGAVVRHRHLAAGEMPGEVITGADEDRGDPHWWARGLPRSGQAAYLHFARQVLTRTGYYRHPQAPPPPRAAEATHQRIGQPANTSAGTVSVGGFGATCRRGWTRVELTPDEVTDHARELFGHRHCVPLAVSLHRRTGWPLAVIDRQKGERGEWGWDHVMVRHPSGDLVDIDGQRSESEVVLGRAVDGYPGGQRVRDLGGEDALRAALGVAPAIDGPAWHIKQIGFPAFYGPGVVDRVAAAVLRDHVTADHRSPPDPGARATPTTSSTEGSSVMGIEEIRNAVAQAEDTLTEAAGALNQAGDAVHRVREQVGSALQGAEQPEAAEALGSWDRATEYLNEARNLINLGVIAAKSYAGRL